MIGIGLGIRWRVAPNGFYRYDHGWGFGLGPFFLYYERYA